MLLLDLFLINLFIMFCCWIIATYNQRAGLVDVAWSFCIAINVIITAFMLDSAPNILRLFIGFASGLWFIRLCIHLFRRYLSENVEDTRYANMRRAMGAYQHVGFLVFFIFQAGLAILFSYPMISLLNVSTENWNSYINITILISAVIMCIALIGETVADQQLYKFKLNPNHQGKTLDQGLWKYSRHPNYFFEWLHWFAYPILGLAAGIYILWIYPILMLLFLYYITGIPFSEQQALAHRGENYACYQRRTSIFFPWPPKQ